MTEIGYYRYKINPATSQDVNFYVNNILASTKSIVVKDICDESRILKYLDKKGQYRFYPFNKFWESKDKPKLIGKSNKIIESILNSQSSTSNIGYKNVRTVSLVADSITSDEMLLLSDIYTSPRVYLYIGSTGDLAEDWLEVEIKKGDQVKMKKAKFGTVSLDIILPEWYTIKMM